MYGIPVEVDNFNGKRIVVAGRDDAKVADV
jgi:hypothetical protein